MLTPATTGRYARGLALLLCAAAAPNSAGAQPFPTLVELIDLRADNGNDGSRGVALRGITLGDTAGWSASGAGDINGDGIDDVIIGSLTSDRDGFTQSGEAYAVFGRSVWAPEQPLALLDGRNGFAMRSTSSGADLGEALAMLGDFNGDGLDDFAVTASGQDSSNGRVYVVFGRAQGFPSVLDLSALDGSDGFVFLPPAGSLGARLGRAVAAAGDFNGDGLADIVMTARAVPSQGGGAHGEAFLVFGSDQGSTPTFALDTLDGRNGVRLRGAQGGFGSGAQVSGGADLNNDGFDDIIVSANLGGAARTQAAHVVYGTDRALPRRIVLATLQPPTGFVFTDCVDGPLPCDPSTGNAVGSGDFNGDGIADAIIADSLQGEAFVLYGPLPDAQSPFNAADIDGQNGFVLITPDPTQGNTISAGDINGDGIEDIAVSTPGATGIEEFEIGAGRIYVLYGRSEGFPRIVPTTALNGRNGFTLVGEDISSAGQGLGAAGDVNGDGVTDLIVGAPFVGIEGEAYIVFGRRPRP
ncbi:MAG: hypothetical protein AAGA68_15600 [Pseudomonadota bacterium]